MNSDLLMALMVSKESFERLSGKQPLVLVCSQELSNEIGTDTIFGCPIEVDENLFGINDYFWM